MKKLNKLWIFLLILLALSGMVGAAEQLGERSGQAENFDFLCQINVNTLCQTITIGNVSDNVDMRVTNISMWGDIASGDLTTRALIMSTTTNASGARKPNTTLFETSTFATSLKWVSVGNGGWGKNISFNREITLLKDTSYAICLRFDGCQVAVNQFGWNGNTAGNYSGGSLWKNVSGSFQSQLPAWDSLFKIWGDPVINDKSVNETQTLKAIETDTISFTLNISLRNNTFENSSAKFYYNNTLINPTKLATNKSDFYTASVTLPFITSDSITQSFHWEYNYSNTTNTLQENTTTGTTTVYQMQITQCNVSTTNRLPTQNFTVRDELTDDLLDANATGTYNVWIDSTKKRLNQFRVNNMNNFSACIYPEFASYFTDIDFSYQRPGYGIRNYVQSNFTIDNTTESITLYLLATGSGTDITVTVNDQDDVLLQGILVQVLRDFNSNGTFELIDSEVTNWIGEVGFTLNTDHSYKFRLYQDGTLKIDAIPAKIVSTALFFRIIDQQINRFVDFLNVNTIDRNLTHSNITDIVRFEWVDLGNYSSEICLNITANNTNRYSNCTALLRGNMEYLITQQNLTYFATGFAKSRAGNTFVLEDLAVFAWTTWQEFGNDGLFIAFLIYLMMALLMIKHPQAAIISGDIGLFLIYFFRIVAFDIVQLIGLIIIHVIIIIRMRKK